MSEPAPYTKSSVSQVIQAIQAIREVHSDMQVDTARLFVLIAMHPGITMQKLREITELSQPTVSRSVALLSEWKTPETPGLGLVTTAIDPQKRRRKTVDLTEKGEELASSLANAVR